MEDASRRDHIDGAHETSDELRLECPLCVATYERDLMGMGLYVREADHQQPGLWAASPPEPTRQQENVMADQLEMTEDRPSDPDADRRTREMERVKTIRDGMRRNSPEWEYYDRRRQEIAEGLEETPARRARPAQGVTSTDSD
jgi:hypothetical protein